MIYLEKKLKTENYIVAFIDVLGAKEMIKKDADGSLNTIHSVYEKALKMYKNNFSSRWKIEISIFSDNIVVARRNHSKSTLRQDFRILQMMVAIIQGNFLISNVLVRGGIAYGKFFFDDVMIWGDALTRAYLLENSVAIYPRIVIDSELIEQLQYFNSQKDNSEFWLRQDTDGIFYVDYWQEKYLKEFDMLSIAEMSRYEARAAECNNDMKIMQKITWQLNYILSKMNGESTNETADRILK